MFISEGKQLQDTEPLNSLLPLNQTELNLLLLINNDQTKTKDEMKNIIKEKEILHSFSFQPLPIEFDESSQAPILKISYEDQHRRVQFDGASYAKLIELCTYFFGIRNPHRMVICYQDEDSDMIQISSDAELLYALTYHTTPYSNGLKILKLFFSLKKKKLDAPLQADSVFEQSEQQQESQKKLKAGAVVLLTTKNFGEKVFLTLQGNQIVGRPSQDDSPNAQWLVEPVPKGKDTDESSQVIFLSNPLFTTHNKKTHLRVNCGRIDHTGGNGNWVRFHVEYLPNSQIKLRSVGRFAQHPDRCFLGIVKKQNEYVAVGDLPEDAPEAFFNFQVISK